MLFTRVHSALSWHAAGHVVGPGPARRTQRAAFNLSSLRQRAEVVELRDGASTGSGAGVAAAADPNAALQWLVEHCSATPDELSIKRRYMGEEQGWGVVAVKDVEPGEVLLSVPLTWAITSEGVDEQRWSVAMARELLDHVSQGAASPLRPWIEALPQRVPLPWLYYNEEEIAAIQDEDALFECRQLQRIYEAACQESPFSREQLAWALSVIHSRSFLQGGAHVFVPGIDFCNHTLSPSATVRCVHSPGSCQGAAAVEDVCLPPPPEPSRFELVAGEDGLRAGEEVTISYGRWPNDVFLMFFGFVPRGSHGTEGIASLDRSSNDSVVLFSGLEELALCFHRRTAGVGATVAEGEEAEQILAEQLGGALQEALGPDQDFSRLIVTAEGFDGRLGQATSSLAQLYPCLLGAGTSGGAPGVLAQALPQLGDFLLHRCQEVLGGYPTTWEQDVRWLTGPEGAGASENLRTAVRFRMEKKAILRAAIEQLTGP